MGTSGRKRGDGPRASDDGRPPGQDARPASGTGADARPLATRTLSCLTVATGRFRQRHHVRDLPPFGERPAEDPSALLGDALEPNASECLLAALGSCLSAGIHANAVARSIPVRRLEIELEGEIATPPPGGTAIRAPGPLGFETIRITVRIDADTPREILEALVEHATLWSPVANTVHDPVHLDVALAWDDAGPAPGRVP